MMLKCPRLVCRNVWDFKGKNIFVTSCPKCLTTMSIKRANKRALGLKMKPRKRDSLAKKLSVNSNLRRLLK